VKKKSPTVLIEKKERKTLFIFSTSKQPPKSKVSLFIINDSHQQQRPCHQRRLSQSQWQTHHHREDHCISPQIHVDLLPPTQISGTSTADLRL
jgi:hypothetical protein